MGIQPSFKILKIDLHCHTCHSYDSDTKLADIISRCDEKGIQKIAITDHGTIEGAIALQKMRPDLVIVGEEMRSTRGDIIGLFLTETIPDGLTPKETAEAIKKQGGLVYVPHPFDIARSGIGGKGLREIEHLIDIVEVFNGKTFWPPSNRKAHAWAKSHKKPMAAGSDSHQVDTIGAVYNEIPDFQDPNDLVEKLKTAKRTEKFLGFQVYARSMMSLVKSIVRNTFR